LCPKKKKKKKKKKERSFPDFHWGHANIEKWLASDRTMEGLYFDQSGMLVAKEMVGHANLVSNLVSLCLNNRVEFLWI
jgi:hypothetical protein